MTVDADPFLRRRAPVLFVGHGNPMNAIEDNRWSRGWRLLGARLGRPRAFLCVSAHWFVRGTLVTGNAAPETIHDFGGFPRALFEVQYPAAGDPDLAHRVAGLLGKAGAKVSTDWGLDHGTWSVLIQMRPAADVSVLQLSIDIGAPPAAHLAIGRDLAPLRDEGVVILGSGNITHNLGHALRTTDPEVPTWASSFDHDVARALEQRDAAYLTRAIATDSGRASHPTPDHYLPLLYVFGASAEEDALSFPIEGFDLGSISMRSVLLE